MEDSALPASGYRPSENLEADGGDTTLHSQEQHPWPDHIYQGDCRDVLPKFEAETIDLVVTSPPYADQRKKTYGGVSPDEYVDWFLPISAELYRVLKPEGSSILNIKERVVGGERHTYVIKLILAMREQGWLWTEEYCWHKRNCYPGKWPNRFRDAWERCLHFNKQRHFKMYQDSVMVPVGDWAESRLKSLSETDRQRDESKVRSGFGKKVSNWVGRDRVYRRTSCIWPLKATTRTTAQHSRSLCPPGSSNCSPSRTMWFWTPFSDPGQLPWQPGNWAGGM